MKPSIKTQSNKADKLFSEIIRSKGYCKNCGSKDRLQCAHVFSRKYKQIRWAFNNAFCLCWKCHIYYTHFPIEWENFAVLKLGRKEYNKLRNKALKYGKLDYEEILKRLEAI